jgi:hypothetical protein
VLTWVVALLLPCLLTSGEEVETYTLKADRLAPGLLVNVHCYDGV